MTLLDAASASYKALDVEMREAVATAGNWPRWKWTELHRARRVLRKLEADLARAVRRTETISDPRLT